MKKVYLFLAILLVAGLIFGGCAKPAPAPAQPSAAPPQEKAWVPPLPGMKPGEEDLYFEYTFATSMAKTVPPPGFEKITTEYWYDELEKATKGRFKVRTAYGGILGSATEMPYLVGAGAFEISHLTGPEIAEFTYLSMPTPGWFTLDLETNEKLAESLYKHPLSQEVLDQLNLVYVASCVYSPNYLLIRKGVEPIATAEDIKGLQMGVWSKVTKLWAPEVGMVPVSTTVFEAYEGMMKGMIDATMMGIHTLHVFKLCEVVGQAIATASGGASPSFTFMNKDAWNRLPQYIKDLWWELYPTYSREYYIKYTMASVQQGIDDAKQHGIPIFELPAADEAKLVTGTKPAWEDWIAEMQTYPGGKQVKEFLKDQIADREKIVGKPFTIYTP